MNSLVEGIPGLKVIVGEVCQLLLSMISHINVSSQSDARAGQYLSSDSLFAYDAGGGPLGSSSSVGSPLMMQTYFPSKFTDKLHELSTQDGNSSTATSSGRVTAVGVGVLYGLDPPLDLQGRSADEGDGDEEDEDEI